MQCWIILKNQSDERVAYVDQQGIYNQWLAVDGILKGLNYFNIWQMNHACRGI